MVKLWKPVFLLLLPFKLMSSNTFIGKKILEFGNNFKLPCACIRFGRQWKGSVIVDVSTETDSG